jgi:phosphoglycerol transferase MdoB-like AlkP superfamily enzyme
MKSRVYSRNIIIVFIYRILMIMVLFSLSRIGFYIFNHKMFPGISFMDLILILRGGLLFDISALIYINMLFILLHIIPFDLRYSEKYQEFLKYLFFLTNGLAIAINSADYVYYRFVFKRATSDVFQTFENETNLVKLFFKFQLDYWPVVIFTLFLFFLMILLYNQVKPVKPEPSRKMLYQLWNILLVPLIAVLMVAAAPGGVKHSARPITISSAARFVTNPRDVAIVLNTPFSLMRTFGKKALVRYDFFSEDELISIYNPHHKPDPKGDFKRENIVIIILESFSREYIGGLNKDRWDGTYRGYTPFIDSLLDVSLTFDVSIANGKKSIDAMPSIFASLPSLETPYIISHYANNKINGLPQILKKKGYYSAFFHGAPNGSMGFDSFARIAGFDDYFGLDQYPDKQDFDGIWGVWDEPFFQFFGEKLSSFNEPFLASVFSVSSHHPFKVPEQYKDKFEKGTAPIIEVVGYTDYALRKFFERIADEPWFMNTIFVITADHTNESIHREFQNNFGSFSVPIIFYRPGSDMTGMSNRIAQQIDIMPTLLHYLNYDGEFIAFGNDLLNNAAGSFAFNSTGSTYNLYMNDHLLEMIDTMPAGLFNYRNDKFLDSNLLDRNSDLCREMEAKLKAIIQTYNARLIDNNLTVND